MTRQRAAGHLNPNYQQALIEEREKRYKGNNIRNIAIAVLGTAGVVGTGAVILNNNTSDDKVPTMDETAGTSEIDWKMLDGLAYHQTEDDTWEHKIGNEIFEMSDSAHNRLFQRLQQIKLELKKDADPGTNNLDSEILDGYQTRPDTLTETVLSAWYIGMDNKIRNNSGTFTLMDSEVNSGLAAIDSLILGINARRAQGSHVSFADVFMLTQSSGESIFADFVDKYTKWRTTTTDIERVKKTKFAKEYLEKMEAEYSDRAGVARDTENVDSSDASAESYATPTTTGMTRDDCEDLIEALRSDMERQIDGLSQDVRLSQRDSQVQAQVLQRLGTAATYLNGKIDDLASDTARSTEDLQADLESISQRLNAIENARNGIIRNTNSEGIAFAYDKTFTIPGELREDLNKYFEAVRIYKSRQGDATGRTCGYAHGIDDIAQILIEVSTDGVVNRAKLDAAIRAWNNTLTHEDFNANTVTINQGEIRDDEFKVTIAYAIPGNVIGPLRIAYRNKHNVEAPPASGCDWTEEEKVNMLVICGDIDRNGDYLINLEEIRSYNR